MSVISPRWRRLFWNAGRDETAAETVWAALHGPAALERAGRIRPAARPARLAVAVDAFLA